MNVKFYIPLIIAVAMLLAVTLPVLGLPYCYSEAQLLGDSIFYMKNHGIGMVFNGDSVELPDLFSVAYYLLARFITTNPLVLHIISLSFAGLSIAAAYKIGKFFFSVQAGVMSAAIMTVQNIFLAQSGLVLPVMMLNGCILGGLYTFFREKYNTCTVLMCAAALTDLTGLFASALLLVAYYRAKYKEWNMSQNFILALPIALWFVYQSISLGVCGKFSTRAAEFSFSNFAENARFIFIAQHRWAMTAVLLAVVAVNTVNKNMLYYVKDMAWTSAAMFGIIFITNSILTSEQRWNLVPVSMMAVCTGCAISTLHTSYYSKYIAACAVMAAGALGVTQRTSVGDAYLNYKSKVKVDMKTIELIGTNSDGNGIIFCDKYLYKYLTNKDFGYIDDLTTYHCTTYDTTARSQWAIYTDFAAGDDLQRIREDENYDKRNTIFIGDCTNEIYQKKKK